MGLSFSAKEPLVFRKRATRFPQKSHEMSYKDKASYGSLPPFRLYVALLLENFSLSLFLPLCVSVLCVRAL